MTTAPPLQSPDGTLPARQLRRVEADLVSLSARLDAAVDDPALGVGLAAMGLDQASQAIHLALIEVRDCIRVLSSASSAPAAVG